MKNKDKILLFAFIALAALAGIAIANSPEVRNYKPPEKYCIKEDKIKSMKDVYNGAWSEPDADAAQYKVWSISNKAQV